MSEYVLFVVNLILLVYLVRMFFASRTVTVLAKGVQVLYISVFFFVLGLLSLLRRHDLFAIIQCLMIMAVGVIYSQMKTGVGQQGIVVVGNLYQWHRIQRIDIDETEGYKVSFWVKNVERHIRFDEQNKEAAEKVITDNEDKLIINSDKGN